DLAEVLVEPVEHRLEGHRGVAFPGRPDLLLVAFELRLQALDDVRGRVDVVCGLLHRRSVDCRLVPHQPPPVTRIATRDVDLRNTGAGSTSPAPVSAAQ